MKVVEKQVNMPAQNDTIITQTVNVTDNTGILFAEAATTGGKLSVYVLEGVGTGDNPQIVAIHCARTNVDLPDSNITNRKYLGSVVSGNQRFHVFTGPLNDVSF